jgi:predicted nucleotidyltransferase
MNALAKILSSQIRAGIFEILFGLRDRPVHMREIERLTGFAIGTIQKELKNLQVLDLVIRRRDGNRVYYEANKQNPLYPEIHSLVAKTVGLVYVLKEALENTKDVHAAFVFGSIAKGDEKAASDVDLMVIGSLGLRKLTALLAGTSEKIGREINPHVLLPSEFNRKRKEGDHFLTSVLREPRIFIIGGDHELEAVGR